HHFLGNKLYSNLPRKYKISVTGCAEDCARGLINDLALSGAVTEDGVAGFNVRVGGGLSTQPRFSRWIDVFITPEEAPEVAEHITVGFCVPVGRLKATQLKEFVRLAREYGTHPEVRLTHQQNVLLPWIPNERVDDLLAEPLAQELQPEPLFFDRALQTCTGKEFCGLAKVHTKGPNGGRAAEIAAFLDAHVTPNGHGEDFRLHFAGCSSSCAQHQIADIGIEGVLKKVDGEFVE